MRIPFIAVLCLAASIHAQAAEIRESRQTAASKAARAGEVEFRELYKELVEINTTLSVGSCTKAAEAMAARLMAAGFADGDMTVVKPADRPQDGNLVAYLKGSDPSLKPLLLLAHIDVVEANATTGSEIRSSSSRRTAFFTPAAASDDKAMAAMFTDSMVRCKQGYKPNAASSSH